MVQQVGHYWARIADFIHDGQWCLPLTDVSAVQNVWNHIKGVEIPASIMFDRIIWIPETFGHFSFRNACEAPHTAGTNASLSEIIWHKIWSANTPSVPTKQCTAYCWLWTGCKGRAVDSPIDAFYAKLKDNQMNTSSLNALTVFIYGRGVALNCDCDWGRDALSNLKFQICIVFFMAIRWLATWRDLFLMEPYGSFGGAE